MANFVHLARAEWFTRSLANSLIVAAGTALVTIVVASLGAYSLARVRFPASELASRAILLTYSIPSVILVVPIYKIVVSLGLNDTYWALILSNTTFSVPFALWMLRGFFLSLPRELEEAAMIDGAGRLEALVQIVLPLSIPGLVATALFAFILSWNEFLYALVLTTSQSVRTLPIGVGLLLSSQSTTQGWALIMAAAASSCLPVFLIVILLQRGIVRGVTAGSTKG